MRRLIREPLLHFLLLGAAIFGAHSFISQPDAIEPSRIVVTQGKIEHLATLFVRTWQRPPTRGELDGLIRDYVREEIYTREAMELGLDKDDTIIRRRLRQKLEFVSEDLAALAEPTDQELRVWLAAHPASFRLPSRLTFSHVYLSPKRHGEGLAGEATRLLGRLKQDGIKAEPVALGDPFPLEHNFDALPDSEVRKLFGDKFAAALDHMGLGQWQGPIESAYGAHLVLLHQRTEGRTPDLEEVRDAVRRAWANARRLEANESFYRATLKRYTVTIEWPQALAGKP